jgi:hypothetical protein
VVAELAAPVLDVASLGVVTIVLASVPGPDESDVVETWLVSVVDDVAASDFFALPFA